MRACYRCGTEKPDEEFHRHPRGRGGRRGICKPCANAESSIRHAEWRKTHDANVKANMARYRDRTAEERNLARALRRDARLTPEENAVRLKVRKYYTNKAWREANIEKARAWGRRSSSATYARRKGAQGHATAKQVAARWAYYGQRCWMCGESATQTDHVIPLNRGGPDWPANLRPSCATCNRAKWDQDHRLFISA